MTDAQIKDNLIKQLQQSLNQSQQLINAISAVDSLNDHDLHDQIISMQSNLDKVIATAYKSVFINGYMSSPDI